MSDDTKPPTETRVAGLRLPSSLKPPEPKPPHVVELKQYMCSECSAIWPDPEPVEAHIARQHKEQD